MLQSLGAYSPWGSDAGNDAAGGSGGGGWFGFGRSSGNGRRPRSSRNRRKPGSAAGNKFFAASSSSAQGQQAAGADPSPTPAAGALAAEGEQAGLQFHFEFGQNGPNSGNSGGAAAEGDEWESGSEGAYGSGSDVEDPLALSGSRPRGSSGARPSHLRSGYDGALYGHVWCLGDGSSPAHPRSRVESAGFLAGSTLLNMLLLAFLLWSAWQPRCGEVWIPTRGSSQHLQRPGAMVAVQQPAVVPNVRVSDDEEEGASSSYRSEPPTIAMPALVELEPLPDPATLELPAPTTKTTTAPAYKPKQTVRDEVDETATRTAKEQPRVQPSPPAPSSQKEVALRGSTAPLPENPFPTQVSAGVDRASVDAFQRDFDVATSHRLQWQACKAALVPPPGAEDPSASLVGTPPQQFCPETSMNEQYFQLQWFGRHVAHGFQGERRFVPKFLNCVHLPPTGYKWPEKYPALPYNGGREGPGAVHWPNLRVNSRPDLVEFNKATPKNLFHFDAHEYDQDGLAEMALAAKYIPLKEKVRLALDLGAGGGSFGLLLKRKYDITTVATAFADWPYCEYMTERGELCMLVDVMESMPFAQRSFDLVHVSWVHHGQAPHELWDFSHETDRVLRPGGYLYLRGGWSNSQIIAQRSMYAALGYTVLYERVEPKPFEVTKKVSFGPDLPYEADWTAILLKPIKATPADEATCVQRQRQQETGRVRLPLRARKTPTQEGNEYEA